ncbi:MAG: MASE1 domain-containing protein [Magnetococcales bacterium]|nr:MASE1 domain-containing protein [Magnetococcales bacterium]
MAARSLVSRWVAQGLLVALAYYLAGLFGLALPSIGRHITLIWLPSGIAVAALLRWGFRFWPAVFFGALSVNLSIGSSLPLACGIGVGNTLGPLLTAFILRRSSFHWEFDDKLDVVWLVGATLVGMVVSASNGIFQLWSVGELPGERIGAALVIWWMGDSIGVLLATPLLIALSRKTCRFLTGQGVEALVVALLLLALNWFIFLSSHHFTLAYIPVLVVMWSAMRFGVIGASITVLADAVLSAWGTAIGNGPFYLNGEHNLLILWIYIATHTVVSLVITALQAERGRSEAQAHAAYHRLNKVATRLPGVIYQFRYRADGNASIPYSSDAMRTIFRLEPATLREDASPALDLIHPEDHQNVMDSIRESARSLSPWQQEFRVRYPDGAERWLFGDSVPEREGDGSTLWHGFITDITAQKEVQAEMARAKVQAEVANQAKTHFLSAMSHEIRTPMNIIIGMSDVLSETGLDDKQKYYLTMLKNAGTNLLQLINDILDLSKVEANKLPILAEPVCVRLETREVIDMIDILARKKGVSLELRVDPDLPEWILLDALRFRQCLFNLISNGVKFTECGWVVVDLGQSDGQPPVLQCVVADSGIGIQPEHLTRIFENFTQSDAGISRRYGGTGLGLSLTRRLVEMMGGGLWVESVFGQGSRFCFTLPLQVTRPPVHNVAQGDDSRHPGSDPYPLRILLVEDLEENRALISVYLEDTPHRLTLVGNGAEGVRRVQESPFDLVLMDIEMPVMNGLQATTLIRAWEKETQRAPLLIVALSAHSMAGEAKRCQAVGCDDHLSKPINKRTLLLALGRYGEQLRAAGEG